MKDTKEHFSALHRNPAGYRVPGLLFVFIFLLIGLLQPASTLAQSADIPHVGNKAKQGYLDYLSSPSHKAFAIAPGGAWSWRSGMDSAHKAADIAISQCQQYTPYQCILYARDDDVVFDGYKWTSLWAPYPSAQQAEAASTGTYVGQRFHDLAFRDQNMNWRSISSLRGKLVLVHFWGSWCPPCMKEFPSLKAFQQQLQQQYGDQVAIVMLQVRESFDESNQWAESHHFDNMPLFDSGISGPESSKLRLADGSTIEDREIARAFPSSYVLDKRGIILFSHYGPISDWSQYLEFFEHALIHGESS